MEYVGTVRALDFRIYDVWQSLRGSAVTERMLKPSNQLKGHWLADLRVEQGAAPRSHRDPPLRALAGGPRCRMYPAQHTTSNSDRASTFALRKIEIGNEPDGHTRCKAEPTRASYKRRLFLPIRG